MSPQTLSKTFDFCGEILPGLSEREESSEPSRMRGRVLKEHGKGLQGVEVLSRYPRPVTLNDGTVVNLRLLRKGDKARLINFFTRIPPENCLDLREDVTDRALVASWVDNLNFDLVLPVVSEYEGKIVGYITLQRRYSGWKKHVGDVWLVVSKEFHKKGLRSILIKDVIGLAAALGLEKLLVEIPVKVKMMEAMEAFSRCGFARLTVLEDMVKDQRGSYSGVVVMVYDLQRSHS